MPNYHKLDHVCISLLSGFRLNAFRVAVDLGATKSLILSTLARLTIPLESPLAVSENVSL